MHLTWRNLDVRYRILMAILLAIPLFLTGCNTLEGAGQDVQDAGEEMEEAGDE
jgi:predicted small secreted protein